MPSNERLIRILLLLGILCALAYLGSFLIRVGQGMSRLILILALAWLLAYALRPIAQWLDRGVVQQPLMRWVRDRWGDSYADRLGMIRVPYETAAVLLYVLLLCGLGAIASLIIPRVVIQLLRLAEGTPTHVDTILGLWKRAQDFLTVRLGMSREALASIAPITDIAARVREALPGVIDRAGRLIKGIGSATADLLLVLILSLYIMLDSKRLSDQLRRIVPQSYQDELKFLATTIDRTFGGFLRGQMLMALSQCVFTFILMSLFGLQYAIVTAIASGVVALIPELGAPLAMVAPSMVALTQVPSDRLFLAPLLLAIMFVFQQILLRVVIPRIISEAIGMPPLLVMISVLVGAATMGVWGFFFGIPVAGALYTMAITGLEEIKRATDARHVRRQAAASASELDQEPSAAP